MVYVIACIVGLFVAICATLFIMSMIPSLEGHIGILAFIFLLLWGASIWICQFALWIGVIIGVVALINYAIKKKKPLDMEKDNNLLMNNGKINTGATDNVKDKED